jgi:tripartite-type tricarboxylate transporter receptor subunit TctC
MTVTRALSLSAACLMLSAMSVALAAEGAAPYPSRPIRIVVPFTPGGQPDIVARLMLPRMVEALGQQIIVDNRPGAGGTIGGRIVAGAAPDGYTLMSVSAAHVVAPAVRANVGYDTLKDFAGVTMTANAAYYLVVPPSLNVGSVKELIALAKAKPGQLDFTSAGAGSSTHFAGEMFKFRAGIDIVHVPHKGIPEALTDTMAGRVQIFMAPFGASAGLVRDGKLRALAVSTPQRTRMNPELPTIAEAALPGFRYDSWAALFAPAKTPRAIINRLNQETARALKSPDVEQRLLAVGIEPAPGTPAQLDKFVAEQLVIARDLAKKAGIKPE